MANAVLFNVSDMTKEIYDATLADIDEAGKDHIPSRTVHVACATPDGFFVLDVWESMEEFEAFGQTLMPILAAAGVNVDAVEPTIYEVHNTIFA